MAEVFDLVALGILAGFILVFIVLSIRGGSKKIDGS